MANILFNLAIIAIVAIGIYQWHRFVRLKPYSVRNVHQVPLGVVDVLAAFVASIALPQLVAGWWITASQTNDSNELGVDQILTFVVISSAVNLLACVLLAILLATKYTEFRLVIVSGFSETLSHLKMAARFFTMVVPILMLLQWLLSFLAPYDQASLKLLSENFSFQTVAVTWFGAVIAAPICEEFFFRGVLQTWLHRVRMDGNSGDMLAQIAGGPDSKWKSVPLVPMPVWDWWWPIFASALLFAIAHWGQGLAPIPLFLFGIALGYVYRKTGSIVPSILLHFMLNLFSMFWFTVHQYVERMGETLP